MKKLLFLLLIPFFGFSQTTLQQSWQSDLTNLMVGDTIVYQLDLIDTTGNDIRTLQLDLSVDKNKLTPLGTPTFDVQFDGMTTTFNQWSNYNYDPALNGTDATDLDAQYLEGLGGKYTTSGDHYILRPSMQSTADIDGTLFTLKFKVEESADYSNLVKLNWAYARDVDYVIINDIVGDPLELDVTENVAGSPAGTVTFQLQTPNATNATDYQISIYDKVVEVDYDNDGVMDALEPDWNNATPIQVALDASGKFTTTELKQGVKYWVDIYVNQNYDANTQQSSYPQWLDDVVTVSDLYLVFQQALGGGVDGSEDIFEYEIQELLGNVSNDMRMNGADGDVVKRIDIDDAYTLLAHLTGILNNNADSSNTDANANFYPITSLSNGTFNYSGLFDKYGKNDDNQLAWSDMHIFELSDSEAVTINLGHGLAGDANLSHSTTPNLDDTTKIIRTSDTVVVSQRAAPRTTMYGKEAVNLDLDVVSELKDGKIEVAVNLTKEDLAGMQFNISYDDSRVALEDVVFDTGNTMTNFAKNLDNTRLNFGTIDPQGQSVIKTGQPFKLVFTPKVTLQNTIGLVTFRVTDAVQQDGTQVNLNIN